MKELIKVIAFDADDTLWSNEPFFQEMVNFRLYVWYFVCKVTIKRGIKADGLFLEPNLHLIS